MCVNKVKLTVLVPVILIGLATFAVSGCANPTVSQTMGGSPAGTTTTISKISASKVKVTAQAFNWDGGPEADGLRVWVDLLDANGKVVRYTNESLMAKLTISPLPILCEAGTVLYSDSATLKNSQGDAFAVSAKGIKDIPWQLIDQSGLDEPQKFGQLDLLVTLPDGQQIEGLLVEVPIQP
jgi:hypothetical protein